jgi:hypothetical protein
MSPYARGGVTGIGVITALAGLVELASVFVSRGRRRGATTPDQPPDVPVETAPDRPEQLP